MMALSATVLLGIVTKWPSCVRAVLFGWMLAITISVGLGISLHETFGRHETWTLVFSGLAGTLFLAGSRWWEAGTTWWQRPLQTVGAVEGVVLGLVLSFKDTWPSSSWNVTPHGQIWASMVAAVWPVAAVTLWVLACRRRDERELLMGALPLATIVSYALVNLTGAREAGMLVMNLYLFALGVGTLTSGVRSQRLGLVNAGMLVLAAVILCRFFDADLGFVTRGVAFIVLGIGFLVTNLVMLRRKGAAQ